MNLSDITYNLPRAETDSSDWFIFKLSSLTMGTYCRTSLLPWIVLSRTAAIESWLNSMPYFWQVCKKYSTEHFPDLYFPVSSISVKLALNSRFIAVNRITAYISIHPQLCSMDTYLNREVVTLSEPDTLPFSSRRTLKPNLTRGCLVPLTSYFQPR